MNDTRGDLPSNVDEHVDTWAMIRLAAWGMSAVVAVVAAMFAARTHLGVTRAGKSTAVVAEPGPATSRTTAAQLLAQINDPDTETERLAQAVRLLSADRDRLATRVASLERTLDDLTSTFARLPPALTGPDPQRSIAAPLALTGPVPVVPIPRPGPLATIEHALSRHELLDHGPFGHTTWAEDAGAPVATTIGFGVDLGGANSVNELRTLWASLRAKHAPLLNGLWPIMLVRDRSKPGTFDLRLVAGPLPNAEHAARLCAAFAALGVVCQPAVFNGQRMALR